GLDRGGSGSCRAPAHHHSTISGDPRSRPAPAAPAEVPDQYVSAARPPKRNRRRARAQYPAGIPDPHVSPQPPRARRPLAPKSKRLGNVGGLIERASPVQPAVASPGTSPRGPAFAQPG